MQLEPYRNTYFCPDIPLEGRPVSSEAKVENRSLQLIETSSRMGPAPALTGESANTQTGVFRERRKS